MGATGALLPDDPGMEGVVDLSDDGGVLKRILKPFKEDKAPTDGTVCLVNYVGYCNGKEFDRNHGGYPFEFTLGENKVIKGWEVAVLTMRIGERAHLTCAAAYGYGDAGSEDDVAPGATLVFDIELVGTKNVVGAGRDGAATEVERLAALRAERAELAAKKEAEKEAKEAAKAEAQAKLQAKLAAKGQKGKGGGKGKKK